MRAWTGKTHILRGWRIVFLRSPCVLSARKTMLQLPGGWGKPVLKVSTKKIAVSAVAVNQAMDVRSRHVTEVSE